LLATLKARFDANKARHPGLVWAKAQARLEAKPDQLWSLAEMERSGGEPDGGQRGLSLRLCVTTAPGEGPKLVVSP